MNVQNLSFPLLSFSLFFALSALEKKNKKNLGLHKKKRSRGVSAASERERTLHCSRLLHSRTRADDILSGVYESEFTRRNAAETHRRREFSLKWLVNN